MSKIQQALRKIQARGRQPGNWKDEDALLLAESMVAPQPLAEKAEPEEDKVIFDTKSLRGSGYLPTNEEEARRVTEQFRNIYNRLSNAISQSDDLETSKAQLIVVTSIEPGDGRTFNCINVALQAVNYGSSHAILVDGDLVDPQISQCLHLMDKPGLRNVIANTELICADFVWPTSIRGLSVLPVGTGEGKVDVQFFLGRIGPVMMKIAKVCPSSVLIVDAPTVDELASDSALLSAADAIVIVVKAESTGQQELASTVDRLPPGRPAYFVLNQYLSLHR